MEETPCSHLGISKGICVYKIYSLFLVSVFNIRFLLLRSLKSHHWEQEASDSSDYKELRSQRGNGKVWQEWKEGGRTRGIKGEQIKGFKGAERKVKVVKRKKEEQV